MNRPGSSLFGGAALSFQLGGIPVRIHPWLFVVAAVMASGPQHGLWIVAGRVVAFVLAVVVHELGHAAAARAFGLPAEVDLTFFRGSLGSRLASLSAGRRIAVCAAGPAANLCLAASTFALVRAHTAAPGVLIFFALVNLGWGALNLLPVFPLDGGYALAAAADRVTQGHGERTVRLLSIVLAIGVGFVALAARMILAAFLCGVVAAQSAWTLNVARQRKNVDAIARLHLQAAYEALVRGEAAAAKRHCALVLSLGATPSLRSDSIRLLAYAYATSDDWSRLIELLEGGAVAVLAREELEKYERAARELGRLSDARRIAVLRERFA